MMRRPCDIKTFVLCAALAGIATAPVASQTSTPGFGEAVDVNVINVDVHVTDKNGRRIPGLRKEDFELFEDGKRVAITNFEAVERAATPAPPQTPQPSATAQLPVDAPPPAAPDPGPAPEPLHLVIYVDNFNIRPAHRARALQQIRTFVERDLAPGDQVMVVTSELGLHIRQPFTTDRAAVSKALDGVTRLATYGGEIDRSRRTALEAMYSIQRDAIAMSNAGPEGDEGGGEVPLDVPCSLRIADPIKGFAESARQEVMRTIGSLKLFVNSLSGLPGRKILIHVSDGITVTPGEELFQVLQELCGGGGVTSGLMGSSQDPATQPQDARQYGARAYQASQAMLDAQRYSTAGEWTELAAHANAHRVTLYTLQASGAEALASSQADSGPGDEALRLGTVTHIEVNNRRDSLSVLAADTGGRAVFNVNNLLPELARIQEDLGSYYSLAFTPTHPGDGREHRLEVKVKRPGLRVRHRTSYRDKSGLEQTVDRTLAALFYGSEENPLGVSLELGEPQPSSGGRTFAVPVRLKIPLHKLYLRDNQTALIGKVRLLVAVQGAKGETSKVRQVEVPIQVPREKALVALGQHHLYELTLTLAAGDQRVAVAVRDDATAQTSFLSQDVKLGQDASTR
jgi:VWFA-related protein